MKRPWSIKSRLAWIYSLAAFMLLLALTLYNYWISISYIRSESKDLLCNKIHIAISILQKNPKNFNLVYQKFLLGPLHHYSLRFLTAQKEILFESPGMSLRIPVSAFQAINANESKLHFPGCNSFTYYRNKDHHYLLSTAYFQPLPDEDYQQIQMALDVTKAHNLLVNYEEFILIIIIFGTLISITIGVTVVNYGMKPLRQITESIRNITIDSLREKLSPNLYPIEIYQLAIAFNHMLDKIDDNFRRLSQFSNEVAHEFRTPLTIIMSQIEVALSKPRTEKEYHEILGQNFEELEILAKKVDNLLFLARAKNSKKALIYREIDVNKILQEKCEFYGILAENKNIQITYGGQANLWADPLLLRRAISNLITNSIRHTPPHGKIFLSVHSVNDSIYISVQDNGEGISAEHLPHLFDRYYRGDPAKSDHSHGLGLGLAMVKSIMDLHEGHINVESKVAHGTKITLIFPKHLKHLD